METSNSRWEDELAELKGKFVKGLDARFQQVSEQFELKNWDKVANLAHQMKGAAASYGFKKLANEAKELESIAKSNDEIQIGLLLERVATEINLSKSGLN